MARYEPDGSAVEPRQNAEAVMLNFMQPAPGGTFAGDGRQGSIIPKPGRVRSRNDMSYLIGTTV